MTGQSFHTTDKIIKDTAMAGMQLFAKLVNQVGTSTATNAIS